MLSKHIYSSTSAAHTCCCTPVLILLRFCSMLLCGPRGKKGRKPSLTCRQHLQDSLAGGFHGKCEGLASFLLVSSDCRLNALCRFLAGKPSFQTSVTDLLSFPGDCPSAHKTPPFTALPSLSQQFLLSFVAN
jgi:hypothetical protein